MPRSVLVKIGADITDLTAKLRQGGQSVRGFVGELDRAAKGQQLDEVANAAGALGLGLLAAGGAAVKFAADFDKQMSAVAAATKASVGQMDRLRAAALQAGKDTSFSATEAAKGIEELAKAGVSTSAILSGGLKGALDLAAAGGLEVAEAAEIAASAMTQFGLDGGKVPHVADLLAAAAGKAQGSVHDMGMALSQAGLVAAQMGLSVEDTTGTLAAFASAGMMGSDAGTSLRTGLLMLANPSAKAAELMEQLGIHAYNASGQFVGISALAGQLKTQLGGLTQEQRNAALATIFGQDAIRGASILYEQGAEGIQQWIDKTNETGYASDTASKKLDNLAGDVERLKGSLETLAIESATGASSGLRTVVQAADRLVGSLAAIPAPVQNAGVLIAAVGGAALLAAAGAAKLRSASQGALDQLSQMGPAGEKAATGLDKAATFATRAAVALAAVQTASAVLGSSTNAQIGMLAKNLTEYGESGKTAGEMTRLFNEDLNNLRYDLGTLDSGFWADFGNGTAGVIEGLTGMGNVMDQSLVHAKERISALDSALAELVQSGRTGEAEAAFARLAAEAKKQGVSIEELKLGLPQYAAALDAASSASGAAADASGTTTEAVGAVGEAAKNAEEQVKALQDAFDSLFGVQVSLDEAAINSAESVNALSDAIKENGRSTDINTEKGRANRESVLNRIKTIKDERQARLDNGMTMDEANGKYVREIDALRKTLRQAGFNEKQINELTAAYRKIPEKVNTNVTVAGDKGVVDKLQTLYAYQNALRVGKPMADIRKQLSKDNADFLKGFHSGGWTGPGDKHQPAGVVHADEYVIKKASRKRIEMSHPGLLDEMNATGQVPGYARGGWVWPFPVDVSRTRIPSQREVASKVPFQFGQWPSSPAAQRGDSGVWRQIVALIRSTGPMSGAFGNAFRPGDPLWHGCVPMDTRILTRRGWITYDEVVVGEDETVGYNPTTGKNEWTLIVGMHRYDDAEVWKLQNKWFTAEVTPGHKWLVDDPKTVQTETVCTECGREFTTGRGMTTHRGHVHKVYTPRAQRIVEDLIETRHMRDDNKIHLSKPADLGGQLPITDDEAELIGWIFADGYMEPYGPTIVQSKPEQVHYLREFMAKFPHSVYRRPPKDRQTFEIFRFALTWEYWQDLSSRSKASKAEALGFVLNLSVTQRAAFVRGFLSADGTRDPRTADERLGYAAFQVSGPVAEAVKVAAYLEGYRPDTRVKTEFDADRFGTQPMEHIGFRMPTVRWRKLDVVEKRTADVWCPTTTLGTWTARQGEEIFLTGNSGRAVDWMGFNQDALASFLAARRPLELIHRGRRDWAYTRGRNMGSFDEALMNAHRNHIHIAMQRGGIIGEPVVGIGKSGASYSFGEGGVPEAVTPLTWRPGSAGPAATAASGGARTVVVEATLPITLGDETIVRRVRLEVDTVLGQLADSAVYGI